MTERRYLGVVVRNPKNIVLESELLASAPERVRAWLEETAKRDHWRDQGIERSLLERRDPLITLSLARLASHVEILREIFAGPGAESKAVRLGVLMNEVAREGWGSDHGIPNVLVAHRSGLEPDPSDVAAFITGFDEEEVAALFLNPALDRYFLKDFLKRKEPWQALDEARRLVAIEALSINPRMQRDDEDFSAAWELAINLPVCFEWAKRLSWLYEKLRPSYLNEEYREYLDRYVKAVLGRGPSHSLAPSYIEEVLKIASRWVPDPADSERVDWEKSSLASGDLGVFARTRQGIARLAVEALRVSAAEARPALLNHEDPAVRAAFYAAADLTLEEMKTAAQRDPRLAFKQIVRNPAAWLTQDRREFLHEMAHDRDPEYTDYLRTEFKRHEQDHRKRHPEWFKDERDTAPGAAPVTSGVFGAAINGVIGELHVATELAKESRGALLRLLRRTAWLGWGIAIVLAVMLIRSLVGQR